MRNSWIIAMRELKERIFTRSFIWMSILGPLSVLLLIYFLFQYGGTSKQRWQVLVTDPTGLLENKIYTNRDHTIEYAFLNAYLDIEDFKKGNRYQQYDAMVEVNEKVLTNKVSYVFYREKPSVRMQTKIQFNLERRIEELMIDQFTNLKITDFRRIKQPLNIGFRDVNDPTDESSDLRAWVGFFFGAVIILFIFLFGMTILRSISREKSNRIVEVLLAAVPARQLLLGKIFGIGFAAFIQFFIWVALIGAGLFYLRENIFIDLSDAANWKYLQATAEVQQQIQMDQLFSAREYNEFVGLIYERIHFGVMLSYFFLFFIAGYLFYATFFAAIGATSGSESDGQQFVLPLIFILGATLLIGYFAIYEPESTMTTWASFIPFTSPMIVMIKLALGYSDGTGYQLFLSLLILAISALLMLVLAGRLYKNGILKFGHQVRLMDIFQWLKKDL